MQDVLSLENMSRACLNCGIVLTFAEFYYEGCPNCDLFMQMKNNVAKVIYCTSSSYFNLCFLPEGTNFWGTSLIDVETFRFGMYALVVTGKIPLRILTELLTDDRRYESEARSL